MLVRCPGGSVVAVIWTILVAIWVALWLCAAGVVVRVIRNGALHGMRRCSGRSRGPDQRSRITERRRRLVLFVEPDDWSTRGVSG